MCIIGNRPTYSIDFGEFKIYSFVEEYKKEVLCIAAYGVKL